MRPLAITWAQSSPIFKQTQISFDPWLNQPPSKHVYITYIHTYIHTLHTLHTLHTYIHSIPFHSIPYHTITLHYIHTYIVIYIYIYIFIYITILYYIIIIVIIIFILYHIILYYILFYYIIYYITLYYIILYYIILYCIILYFIILYYIIYVYIYIIYIYICVILSNQDYSNPEKDAEEHLYHYFRFGFYDPLSFGGLLYMPTGNQPWQWKSSMEVWMFPANHVWLSEDDQIQIRPSNKMAWPGDQTSLRHCCGLKTMDSAGSNGCHVRSDVHLVHLSEWACVILCVEIKYHYY